MPASPAQATVGHKDMANAIRALSMDAVEAAKSGHPGLPMGMADVATVLYSKFLRFDPQNPTWPDRDRLVHSAGHGSMLLYSILHLTGYEALTLDEIKRFRQLGALTAGHPEVHPAAGIETTTGPLGQGISNAVGMALAERILNARFGDELVDHRTFVLCSDGDLMEGVSSEACSLAGHLGLGRLIVLYDDNQISIDGPTTLAFTENTMKRFEAYGWDTQRIDGHDPAAIEAAIARALETDTPSIIACRTVIGFGAPTKAGKASSHGSPLGAEEIAGAREKLGWPHAPFVIPEPIMAAWRTVGRRSGNVRGAWEERLAKSAPPTRSAFAAAMAGKLPETLPKLIAELKAGFADEQPKIATRVASGRVLEALVPAIPELIGGSADLTGSNNTKTKASTDVAPGRFGARYVNYGVREHGMAAIMNGMALHGGVIPYAGTFLTFSDYCRPSIRLSALMERRVIYVMTHDSIGLGEDGPTHQPVEHLAALRAIPNLQVFRPADAVETAEAWALMLQSEHAPSVITLTRQGLPTLRTAHTDENLTARGAYVLQEAGAPARVTLLATGSEVAIAAEARSLLEAEGIGTRLVSMPCWELFERQSASYRDAVLGPGTVRVAIEAAVRMGWDRWIGPDGAFVGMPGFGASGRYEALYEHFGITARHAVDAAKARL